MKTTTVCAAAGRCSHEQAQLAVGLGHGSRWPRRPQGCGPAARGSTPRGAELDAADRARLGQLQADDACIGCWAAGRTHLRGFGTIVEGNRFADHDVIVVDETSMVSLTMMARLLEAVAPGCPADPGRRRRPSSRRWKRVPCWPTWSTASRPAPICGFGNAEDIAPVRRVDRPSRRGDPRR